MFNENSALVKLWIRLIKIGDKTIEDIPNILNLREIVVNSI